MGLSMVFNLLRRKKSIDHGIGVQSAVGSLPAYTEAQCPSVPGVTIPARLHIETFDLSSMRNGKQKWPLKYSGTSSQTPTQSALP